MKKAKTSNRKVIHQLNEKNITKNSASEVSHTISKIKERELEITILWVILFLILLCGSLYITFTSVQKFEEHNTLKNGTLITDYDSITTGMGDIITITGNDSDENIYDFKVTNSSSKQVKYSIVLEDDLDMVEYDDCSNKLISNDKIFISLNGTKEKSLDKFLVKNKYIIKKGTLEGKEVIKFSLHISTKNNDKNKKHYHGKIVVEK